MISKSYSFLNEVRENRNNTILIGEIKYVLFFIIF